MSPPTPSSGPGAGSWSASRCGCPTLPPRSSRSERQGDRPPALKHPKACATTSIAEKVRVSMPLVGSCVPARLAAFVLACACSKQASTSAPAPAWGGSSTPDGGVATYKGGKITAGELEKEARPQLAELENKMYQARKQVL